MSEETDIKYNVILSYGGTTSFPCFVTWNIEQMSIWSCLNEYLIGNIKTFQPRLNAILHAMAVLMHIVNSGYFHLEMLFDYKYCIVKCVQE